jgi:hypothetical protein
MSPPKGEAAMNRRRKSGAVFVVLLAVSTVETEGSGPVKVIVSKTIHSLTNSVYDVEQGKVVKQFEGHVWKWVGSGNEVVVERDGKVVLEEMP